MLHRKQFAVLKERLTIPEFKHIPLKDGWILNYHQQLPVYYNDEKQSVIIGYVWQAFPEKLSPGDTLAELRGNARDAGFLEQVLVEEESWCGRYVVIVGSRVLLDAIGSRGVFYSSAGFSSDVQLLAECMGKTLQVYQQVEHLTWCPGPMTAYDDILRLLPSQIYDYDRGELLPRQLLAQSHRPVHDDAVMMKTFVDLFCASLRNMEKTFQGKKLLVAVTGGYDSRTVLALAVRAGIPIEGFSMEHDEISVGDRDTPPLLCQKLNLPYTVFPRKKDRYDRDREREFIQHVAGTYHAKDRNYYVYHQYDDLTDRFGDTVLIRGNIWEAVINSYRKYFNENVIAPDIIKYYCLDKYPKEKSAIEKYFQWCEKSPQCALSPRVRFDWEQNMAGCWMAEGEHAFDLYSRLTSAQPLNCRLLITMLLDFPEDERFTRHHQTRITEYACPALAGIPYGSEKVAGETVVTSLLHKTQRAVKRLKNKGLKETLAFYGGLIQDRFHSDGGH